MAKLNFITKRRNFTPLNLGGIIFTSAMLGLLLGPGLGSNDLLATTIACCFLATLTALGIATFISYLFVKKNFNFALFAHSDNLQGKTYANEIITLNSKINKLWLLPLTRVRLQLHSEDLNLKIASHELVGSSSQQINLSEKIKFPHRGIWNFEAVKVQIQDAAGLWNFGFTYKFKAHSIKVEPQPRESSSVAVISSVYTSGDTIPLGEQRLGDFYDLKSYHPSDGVNRIAWKIFAKSGQLITRQPEKEIRPDGKALVFCCAGPEDDQIAAECSAYLRLLESLEIDILFNCEGSHFSELSKSSAAALELLIEAGRHTSNKIAATLMAEVNNFAEQARLEIQEQLCSVIIFIGESRLNSKQSFDQLLAALKLFANQNFEPVLVCRNPDLLARHNEKIQQNTGRLTKLLIFEDASTKTTNLNGLNELITASSKSNWNILTCP